MCGPTRSADVAAYLVVRRGGGLELDTGRERRGAGAVDVQQCALEAHLLGLGAVVADAPVLAGAGGGLALGQPAAAEAVGHRSGLQHGPLRLEHLLALR